MAAEQEYQVVARRYRPQRFDELIGQEHIAKALSNAIQNNRIGHAYLFTGARGVGKTSSARIFAKSLNCVEGPTSTPCNHCEICQGITQGEDLDVIEIDGASNRGIDQIRTLIQNVNVRPVRSRFKIFIIDEVHMLTNEAFNALLKTLEEPPEHVKFIFCTTEVNKIPITILSRCQRFDFAGIGTSDIANRLQKIVADEGLTAEPDAIRLLARRANGSMRDGQSLLEQLLAFTSGNISLQNVHQLLGTANDDVLIEILRNIMKNEPAGILRALDLMIQQGADPGQFLEQLFGCLRDLMALLAGCGSESFLFLPPDIEEEAREMAQKMGLDLILAAMQIVDHTLTRMKISTQGRLLAEMAFVRICSLQSLVSLSDVISQTGTDKAYLPSAASSPSEPPPATTASVPERFSSFSSAENRTERLSSPDYFQQENPFPEMARRKNPALNADASDVNFTSRGNNGEKTPLAPPPEIRRSFTEELAENPTALNHALNKKKETEPELNPDAPQSIKTQEDESEALNPNSLRNVQSAPYSTESPAESTPIVSDSKRNAQASNSRQQLETEINETNSNETERPSEQSRRQNFQDADNARVLEIFLKQLTHFQNNPSINCLAEIKDISWSADGRQLTVVCPQRCEFGLQQFQKDSHLVKTLEKQLALAFERPALTLKFIVEQVEGPPQSETSSPGLRQLYQNPLVQAAESLFDATILRVENIE